MLIEQGACIEIVAVLVDLLVPQQMRAASHVYALATAQARVPIVQGPAQIPATVLHLVITVEGEAQLADVSVELRKISLQR